MRTQSAVKMTRPVGKPSLLWGPGDRRRVSQQPSPLEEGQVGWAGAECEVQAGDTYMEKLVMKAFLGSSIWKAASCTVSALLTTRLVITVRAKRAETSECTVRL